MADLKVICYGQTANDGLYPVRDKFLGKVTISTLSSTSQAAALLPGTRYVKLVTDATVVVYFAFGNSAITATTASDELNAVQNELIMDRGIDGKQNTFIAARIA